MVKTMKYGYLLEEPNIKRWYDNLKVKSQITAGVYLRTLGLYCELNDTTPERIVEESTKRKFDDDFTDFVRRLEERGKAGSYIVRFKKVLKSWLRFNDRSVDFKVNIKDVDETPTIADERVPTKEELARILRKASSRGRVSVSLIAFSGLRPESLGNYDGSDGIRLNDFEGIKLTEDSIEFDKVPAKLTVRNKISKARNQYFTFIPEEGVKYLREYMAERISQGEDISMESQVIGFDIYKRGHHRSNDFLRTTLVTRDIKDAIKSSGLSMRPYVLRAYFATGLDISESKGLISHPWRMFIMGHKGDIESRYSTNKGRLLDEVIEGMRSAYTSCLPYLQTESRGISTEDKESLEMNITMSVLKKLGFSDKDIEEMAGMDDEEFQKAYREKKGMAMNNGHKQKVILQKEIKHYIEDLGWEFVKDLNTRESIVRLPD